MQSKISDIKFWLLCLIGFMLTFYIFLTPLCIVLFAVAWLAEGDIKRKLTSWLHNKFALLFISLYAIYLIGSFYSIHQHQAWFDMQIKLSLLLFPFILSSEKEIDFSKQKWMGFAFISGCVLHGVYCLVFALYKYFAFGISEFIYMPFSKFVHPTYYSMYIDLAFVFIYYVITEKSKELSKKEKYCLYAYGVFLLLILALLNSKMGLITTALLFLIFFIRFFLKRYSTVNVMGVVLLAIALLGFGITKVPRFNAVFDVINGKNRDVQSVESSQARWFVWQAAGKVVEHNPIYGSGTGDAKYDLLDQYQKDGMTGAYKEILNAHNQYLQTLVAVGIPGLLILLANLFIPLAIAIKRKRFVYAMLILILCLNFLTESMLDQQAGTMFYGLFNSLLMFNFVI